MAIFHTLTLVYHRGAVRRCGQRLRLANFLEACVGAHGEEAAHRPPVRVAHARDLVASLQRRLDFFLVLGIVCHVPQLVPHADLHATASTVIHVETQFECFVKTPRIGRIVHRLKANDTLAICWVFVILEHVHRVLVLAKEVAKAARVGHSIHQRNRFPLVGVQPRKSVPVVAVALQAIFDFLFFLRVKCALRNRRVFYHWTSDQIGHLDQTRHVVPVQVMDVVINSQFGKFDAGGLA
mmetsp:Transcript_48951/g.104093  ORF Transcript_48951/g.104093 Transcript_48951/m.104093 type:complete len:238 (+) Transcript_48951:37-750(+)